MMNRYLCLLLLMFCFITVPTLQQSTMAQSHEIEGRGKVRTRGIPKERDKIRGREAALRNAYKNVALELAQSDVEKKVFLDRLKEMTLEELEEGVESEVKLQEVANRRGNYLITLQVTIKEGIIEDMLAEPISDNLDRMRMRRIMVVIPEKHIERPVPDPAGETEMIRVFLDQGFRVVDQKQIARIRESDAVKAAIDGASNTELVRIAQSFGADYLIYGEAFSHEVQSSIDLGSMQSCRARVEARMVRADTGEILAADGKEAGKTDLSSLIAGKEALREAAQELAEGFVASLMKRSEIEGDEEFITIVIGGASFGQKEQVKGLLSKTPDVIEVREVEYQVERATLEVTSGVGAGALAGILYTAAANANMEFNITEQTAARIVGRMIPQPVAPIIQDTDESSSSNPPQDPRPPAESGILDDGTLTDVSKQRWIGILIGIQDYQGSIPDLGTPHSDVDGLAKLLKNQYRFNEVKVIRDGEATLRGLRETFDQLGATLTPEDNVLIYYAGHGHLQENTDVGLWITSDATDHLDGLYNAEIKAYIAKMPARRVLLVSDSCYSGDFLRRAVGRVRVEQVETDPDTSVMISSKLAANPLPSREVLTSGNLAPVPDEGRGFCKGHSPFACALINALESAPVGAPLSTNDLYYHVSLFLDDDQAKAQGSDPQKGTLPEHRGGEFFLVRFNQ